MIGFIIFNTLKQSCSAALCCSGYTAPSNAYACVLLTPVNRPTPALVGGGARGEGGVVRMPSAGVLGGGAGAKALGKDLAGGAGLCAQHTSRDDTSQQRHHDTASLLASCKQPSSGRLG
jgi:hypothetical protein